MIEGKVSLTVYLDVIWLLNFFFDLFLILLTGLILKRKLRWWKIITASLLGSSMVLFLFTPYGQLASHPIAKLLTSCFIVLLAFGFGRFRIFFQNLLSFYFVSFVVGGGMLGTYFFFEFSMVFQDSVLLTNSNSFGDPISWTFVLIGFPIAWYYARHQFDQVEMTKIQYDQIVQVTIRLNEKVETVKGLIDSGNQLYDPISKTPVMIIETGKVQHIIPPSILAIIEDDNPIEKMHEVDTNWLNKLRIIPYRGVGNDHQFLVAFKPDEVTIEKNSETIVVSKVFVGLNGRSLSADGNYECIVHPKMLQSGRIKNVS